MNPVYTYDPIKAAKNLKKHRVAFDAAADFDWSTALIVQDSRRDYGEVRYAAYGMIGARAHVLIFTPRDGTVHIISLRKANKREVKLYEEAH
jgi:uncharacterized DUF497 family protein